MAQKTTRSRAAAVRAAREAKAARDRERREREDRIEAALADFYEGSTEAARVRADARMRAERIIGDAEERARLHDAQAGRGIRALRALDQTTAQIAELCGLSPAAVRSLASDPEGAQEAAQATGDEEPGAADAATGEHDDGPGTKQATGEGKEGAAGSVADEPERGRVPWPPADG